MYVLIACTDCCVGMLVHVFGVRMKFCLMIGGPVALWKNVGLVA